MNIIIRDQASTVLNNLRTAIAPEKLHPAIATKMKQQVQAHLIANGTNKKGWPTTSFYPSAAHNTIASSSAHSALITINQVGIAQRYYGGPIRPVTANALTIPIDPLSYGHRASEFPNLIVINTPKGTYLAQSTQTQNAKGTRSAKSRAQAAPRFLFKLVNGVSQKPDHTILPTREEILATAVAEVNRNIHAAIK